MTFADWLDTFVEEKNIGHETLQVEGNMGTNFIPMESLVATIKSAPQNEQAAIKNTLVQIDFVNGNALLYFTHLAKAIAL